MNTFGLISKVIFLFKKWQIEIKNEKKESEKENN